VPGDRRRGPATVTVVFGGDEPEIERRMMDVRHEFEASIRSNSHNCPVGRPGRVEVVVEAVYGDALQFIRAVRGADESLSVETRSSPSTGRARKIASTGRETARANSPVGHSYR
jgi:CopG family nickel-responsive transcriptional regulator